MKKYLITERPDLFEPDVYISIVVTLRGENLKKEIISDAVNEAYQANEVTMSKIVLDGTGNSFYEKMDHSGCTVFIENQNWEELLRESEKNTFAIKEGELVRTYITGDEMEYVLFIHAHHLAGDAKAVLILLQDIFDALNKKKLFYKPLILFDPGTLQKKARLPWWVYQYTKRLNQKWKKWESAAGWKEYDKIHEKYWNTHETRLAVKNYPLHEIKEKCGDGITVNSLLVAELLRENPLCKKTGIPVSIRDNVSMSNQTSGIEIAYSYQKNQTFEQNTRKVQRKIKTRLKNPRQKYFVLMFLAQLAPTLIDAILLQVHGCVKNPIAQKAAEALGYTGKRKRQLGVTNLGKITFLNKENLFEIKDVLFIPPMVSYTKNVVGISSFGDTLHIVKRSGEER